MMNETNDPDRVVADALAERSRLAVFAYPVLALVVVSSTTYLSGRLRAAVGVVALAVVVGALRAAVNASRGFAWPSVALWRSVYRFTALLAAAVWSCGTWACLRHGLDANAAVVIMTTAGIASGATSGLAPDGVLQRTYLLVLLAPAAVACAADGSAQGLGTALAAVAFTAYLAVVGAAAGRELAENRRKIEEEKTSARNHEARARLQADARAAAEAAEAEARAANRAKSAFLANMSHEIRTPMTAVLGYAELLADPEVGLDERAEYSDVLRKNGEHLLRLLNDILDLSKIEAGKLSVELGPCHLGKVLSEVEAVATMRAEEKGISFGIEIDSPIPERVSSDATRLRQVLINLVGNAIKFTVRGRVVIRAGFHAGANGRDGRLVLSVVDSGIGMSEAECAKVFEPFVQADSSSTRRHDGVGLGLAISSHLVRLLGGRISVTSVPGEGSTFTMELVTRSMTRGYLTGRFRVAAPRSGVVETRPLEGVRVLLAEDSEDNMRLLSMFLRRAGAVLDTAVNGLEAFELAIADPYDVVLMDMQMPLLDGMEAVRRLREEGYGGRIVALTANALVEDRARSLAAGCDDHVAKPVSREKLVEAVRLHASGEATPAAAEPG